MQFFPKFSGRSFLGVTGMLHRRVQTTICPFSLCGKGVSMKVGVQKPKLASTYKCNLCANRLKMMSVGVVFE